MDHIPTATGLAKRGIPTTSTTCPLCHNGDENANHLLVSCSFVQNILEWILSWCGIAPRRFTTVVELVNFAATWGNCTRKRKIFIAICYGFLWSVWKARNDKMFFKVHFHPLKIGDNISLLVFGWVKFRSCFGNYN